MKIHIKKIVYVTFNINGNENTQPRQLNSSEEKWMKSTIKEELGTSGFHRLYAGEIVQVGDSAVWLEDFGEDVERDEKLEQRIKDGHTAQMKRFTKWQSIEDPEERKAEQRKAEWKEAV